MIQVSEMPYLWWKDAHELRLDELVAGQIGASLVLKHTKISYFFQKKTMLTSAESSPFFALAGLRTADIRGEFFSAPAALDTVSGLSFSSASLFIFVAIKRN